MKEENWGLLCHEGGQLCNRICSLAHTTLLEVRGQVIISRQKNGPNFVNIIKKKPYRQTRLPHYVRESLHSEPDAL